MCRLRLRLLSVAGAIFLGAAGPPSGLNGEDGRAPVTGGDVSSQNITVPGSETAFPLATLYAQTKNITLFGADPTGTIDATPAWNAACAAIPASGSGVLKLPAGDFHASSPWVCNGRALMVVGAGEGISRIHTFHTGTALSFSPGDLGRRITIKNLSVVADGPCATDLGIDIVYPPSLSYLLKTVSIRNIEIISSIVPSTACNPASFTRGIHLSGVWQSDLTDIVINGPYALPPVAATSGVQWQNSYNVQLDHVTVNTVDVAFEQVDYSEGFVLRFPNMIAVNTGLRIDTATHTGQGGGFYSGLDYTINNAECNVFVSCLDMKNFSTGFMTQSRTSFRTNDHAVAAVILNGSEGFIIDNNHFEGGVGSPAIGVLVTGGAASAYNNINNNVCLNISVCIKFDTNTINNAASANFHPTSGNGNFVNLGKNNYMSWIGGQNIVLHAP